MVSVKKNLHKKVREPKLVKKLKRFLIHKAPETRSVQNI